MQIKKFMEDEKMRINNNIMAMNTHRQYAINNDNMAKATEKLSSGYNINRAGDDAAGLAISEKMRAQIRGLDMAAKNSEDAISLVQTAEGALTETHSILQRMRELATQSSSDTNETIDRNALQAEFTALTSEIDEIADKTNFNGKTLLNGSFGSAVDTDPANSTLFSVVGVASISGSGVADTYTFADDGTDLVVTNSGGDSVTIAGGSPTDGAGKITIAEFGITVELSAGYEQGAGVLDGDVVIAGGNAQIQTGSNEGDFLTLAITSMKSDAIGTGAGSQVSDASIATRADAESAITIVNDAINDVSTQRANLGAIQNRLDHKINNLETSAENLSAAESRIRDVDMAKEMTQYTQTSILVQAATSMLAQANSAPQNVLSLLQ
jgi:flagellin